MKIMSKRWSSALVEYAKVWGLLAVIVVLGFLAAYQFVQPPPPKTVRIATGEKDGAYYAFAQKYARLLARDGITLEVVPTAGSVENLDLLKKDAVSLALVQGGSSTDADRDQLESLGGLFLEPVWVFYRKQTTIKRLSELKGKRVAVGAAGSGTYLLAMQLLSADGITESNTMLLRESLAKVAPTLLEGKIDDAFFVASPEAPLVRRLLREPGIELVSFERAAAYTHLFPFLTSVTLSEGVLDLERNIPSHDTKLVAVAASLVARNDLNDSLIPALLNAITEIHQEGGVLEQRGKFPSIDFVDIPMNDDARRYITNGPSFLHRWFPYRTAVLLDRLKILLLPFLVLIPLFRIAPPLYNWRIRSRIYRWYAAVREIDALVQDANEADVEAGMKRLTEIDKEVASVSVPLSYTGELYQLRLHIGFIKEKLAKLANRSVDL
jgi:TRAP transporter TAXI family solute receptor